MNELIRIRPGDPQPTDLDPGELALDEAARRLFVKTQAATRAIPLDITGLPVVEPDSEDYVVYRESGLAEAVAVISAGGGGMPYDAALWGIPGLMPASVGTLEVSTPYTVVFEVLIPTTFDSLRAQASAGTGDLVVEVWTYTDAPGTLVSTATLAIADTDAVLEPIALTLPVGRYAFVVAPSSAMTLEAVSGYVSGSSDLLSYPLALRRDI